MRQSPELKPNIWDGLVVLVILALAMFAALAVWRGTDSGSAPLVTVTADGTELDRFAPEALLDSPRSYSHNGYTLTVAAERDGDTVRLHVASADCPTQDCVHTGAISRSGQSIICLPARIVITLTGGAADSSVVDVVIG